MLVEQVHIVAKYLLTALRHNFEFSLKCVHISQGGKHGHGGAGRVRPPWQYIPKLVPERAKRPRPALGRNRDFRILTPLERGQNAC